MRKRGKTSSGRGRAVVIVGAAAAAVAAAVFLWPGAEATPPSRCQQLVTICTSRGGDCRKLLALEELLTTDSSAARDALAEIADSGDDRVAAMAIGALGRGDQSGARDKIEAVFEDTDRSDAVRAAALSAHCRLKAADGDSWSDCGGYVRSTAGRNQRLRDAWASVKAKYWPEEADGE